LFTRLHLERLFAFAPFTASPLYPSSAYLLVSHGSRDPRPQAATEQLAQLMRQQFLNPPGDRTNRPVPIQPSIGRSIDRPKPSSFDLEAVPKTHSDRCATYYMLPPIGIATLELAPLPLHEQIRQFGDRTAKAGYRHVKVLPLFLLPGVHVMEDIPAELAIAQTALGQSLTLELCPHLGSHPQIQNLLVEPEAIAATTARILLAHGSRRPGGNLPVAAIAADLNALPAYWSVPPSLEAQITTLAKTNCQEIVISPYFLFDGTITDAIAETVNGLAQQFPSIQLHLTKPLGADTAMAKLVADLADSKLFKSS
jgi:sirohydrochlorin cobaltochelatase